jgi:U3 small nucleolar RNA-associated protein 14
VKPLTAPLPQRTQERFDREASYEQTREEVDKWSATMKHIKEVNGPEANMLIAIFQGWTSQFPSSSTTYRTGIKFGTCGKIQSKFYYWFIYMVVDFSLSMSQPTTELESSIDKLLQSAKMREEDIEKTEELKMNHLSVEEIARWRAKLRKMRELLFRAEVKAKRVAKITSKTYRRLKSKELSKLTAKVDEEVDENDEEVGMKREMDRARERPTITL